MLHHFATPTPPRSVDLRRVHFRSWVLGRFVIQDFFDAALMPMGDAIIAEVFDGNTVDAGKLLMSTWATWGVLPTNAGRRAVTTLPLAGHVFTIQWHTGPSFVREQHRIPMPRVSHGPSYHAEQRTWHVRSVFMGRSVTGQ